MTKFKCSTAGAKALYQCLHKTAKHRGTFTPRQAELHDQALAMLNRGLKIDKVVAWVREEVENG